MRETIRTLTAMSIVPVLILTGYRFSKDYRRAEGGWKAVVYRWVDVVRANLLAGI